MDKERRLRKLLDNIEYYCVFVYRINNQTIKTVVYGGQDDFKEVWAEACNRMDKLENNASGDYALTFSNWYVSIMLNVCEETEFVNINEK